MGQTHPRGQNVVHLRETGAGKDCDFGAPRFDSSYFDPRLGTVGLNQSEFVAKIEEVNGKMKKHYTPVHWVIVLFFAVVILPNVLMPAMGLFGGRGDGDEGEGFNCVADHYCAEGENASTAAAGGCCRLWCCERDSHEDPPPNGLKDPWELIKSKPEGTVQSVDYEFRAIESCTSNYAWVDDNAREVMRGYIWPSCCMSKRNGDGYKCDSLLYIEGDFKGAHIKEGGGFNALGFMLVMVIPMLGVFLIMYIMIGQTCKRKTLINQAFEEWRPRGVEIQYFMPQKHSNGALYFVLPPGAGAPPPVAAAVPLMPIVGAPMGGNVGSAVVLPIAEATTPLKAAAPVLLQVVVPQGVQPGSSIQVQAPDGRQVMVQVPPKAMPGTTIQVQV